MDFLSINLLLNIIKMYYFLFTVYSRLSGLMVGRGGTVNRKTDNPNNKYIYIENTTYTFLKQTIILTCLMLIFIKKICDFGLFAGIF